MERQQPSTTLKVGKMIIQQGLPNLQTEEKNIKHDVGRIALLLFYN